MKDRNETRSKQLRFILPVEHSEDNRANSAEKAVQELTVFKKKMSEGVIDCKDAVTVLGIDDFRRHGKGTVNRIPVAAGRTEAAFATERNKFKVAAFFTPPHDTAISGVSAVDHLIDILNDGIAGM